MDQNYEIRHTNDVLVLSHERQTSPDTSLTQLLFSRQKHGTGRQHWWRAQAFNEEVSSWNDYCYYIYSFFAQINPGLSQFGLKSQMLS